MQLAHAAQDGLAGLAVGLQMQRGIGAHHLAERGAELLLLGLGLRLHRHADDGIRESACARAPPDWPQSHSVSPVSVSASDTSAMMSPARASSIGIGFLGEHLDHAADLLALAARRILHRGALGQHARIHADEGQRAVDVVDDLEGQRRERLIVRALALADRLAVGIHGLDRRRRRSAPADNRRPRRAPAARPCSCRRSRTAPG